MSLKAKAWHLSTFVWQNMFTCLLFLSFYLHLTVWISEQKMDEKKKARKRALNYDNIIPRSGGINSLYRGKMYCTRFSNKTISLCAGRQALIQPGHIHLITCFNILKRVLQRVMRGRLSKGLIMTGCALKHEWCDAALTHHLWRNTIGWFSAWGVLGHQCALYCITPGCPSVST